MTLSFFCQINQTWSQMEADIFSYMQIVWSVFYVAYFSRKGAPKSPSLTFEKSIGENSNFPNFWATWTICTPNQSWEHSRFKFDMKKYDLLQKKYAKINFFMISPHFRWDSFFHNENFSKNYICIPNFFLHPRVQKTLNYNYTKFYTPNFITDKVTSISKRNCPIAHLTENEVKL